MQLLVWTSLLALASAAPHAHNLHQNKVAHNRRAPLLHEDMLLLYSAASTTTSSSAPVATVASGHGPYAAGEFHGGNVKAVAQASDTSASIAATATPAFTSTADDGSSDDDDDSDPASQIDDNNDEIEEEIVVTKSKGVPAWAIALTTILLATSLSGLGAFLYFRFRMASRAGDSAEKSGKPSKKDPEDALASYKAFWESKRQSAGSFTSADASPAALASDMLANALTRPQSTSSNTTLPRYEEQVRTPGTSLPGTPMNEQAPPRGFLYQ